MNWFAKPLIPALLVALFAALLILPGLGKGSLSNYDEAYYAEISKNVAQGHIWTLHYNGTPWFEKPPFYFWCSGALMAVFGPSEWTARAPSAFFGILLVVVTFLIGWECIGRTGALFAAAVLATSPDFQNLARNGMTDTTVLFFSAAAIYCYIRGRHQPAFYYGFWISLALAFMTKYVVAIIPLLAVAPIALYERFKNGVPLRTHFRGILWGALIGLPWFLSLALTNWNAFYWFFWIFNTQKRLLTGMTPWTVDYWTYHLGYHNPGHAFSFLSALAVIAILTDAVRRREGFPWLLLSWLGVVVFVLFMTRTQLAWYLALIYPVLALILGYLATQFLAQPPGALAFIAMAWGSLAATYPRLKDAADYIPILTPEITVFLFVLALLAPTLFQSHSHPVRARAVRAASTIYVVVFPLLMPGINSFYAWYIACLILFLSACYHGWITATARLFSGMIRVVIICIALVAMLPVFLARPLKKPVVFDQSFDEKAIALDANDIVPKEAALIAYRSIQHPIAFYTDHDVLYYNDRSALEAALLPSQLRTAYIITTRAGAIELGRYQLLAEEGNYRLIHGARIGDVTVMDLEIGAEPEVFYVLFSNGDIEERRSGYSKVLHSTDCEAVNFAHVNNGRGFLVLDKDGAVHPAGEAQAIAGEYIHDGSPALEIEVVDNGAGYYLMSHRGTVQNYGTAPNIGTGLPWPPFRAMAFEPAQDGYLILYENGLLYPIGRARVPKGVTGAIWNWAVGQDIEKDPQGPGYYLCDQYGVIHYAGGKPNPQTPYYNPEKGHIVDFEITADGELCILDDKGVLYRGKP